MQGQVCPLAGPPAPRPSPPRRASPSRGLAGRRGGGWEKAEGRGGCSFLLTALPGSANVFALPGVTPVPRTWSPALPSCVPGCSRGPCAPHGTAASQARGSGLRPPRPRCPGAGGGEAAAAARVGNAVLAGPALPLPGTWGPVRMPGASEAIAAVAVRSCLLLQ